jgi:hypothetical protein
MSKSTLSKLYAAIILGTFVVSAAYSFFHMALLSLHAGHMAL